MERTFEERRNTPLLPVVRVIDATCCNSVNLECFVDSISFTVYIYLRLCQSVYLPWPLLRVWWSVGQWDLCVYSGPNFLLLFSNCQTIFCISSAHLLCVDSVRPASCRSTVYYQALKYTEWCCCICHLHSYRNMGRAAKLYDICVCVT